ncbi:MAG: hypothetical protein Q3966_09525 [Neisseria sp.]|nr:hypothetical protein [Neisseria sp.]
MKKFIPLFLACLPLAAQADPVRNIRSRTDFCQHMLQGGAFNRYLETTCGFREGVAAKAEKAMAVECRGVFDQKKAAALSKEAVNDGVMRFKRYGKKNFCAANLEGYITAGAIMDEVLRAQQSGKRLEMP